MTLSIRQDEPDYTKAKKGDWPADVKTDEDKTNWGATALAEAVKAFNAATTPALRDAAMVKIKMAHKIINDHCTYTYDAEIDGNVKNGGTADKKWTIDLDNDLG